MRGRAIPLGTSESAWSRDHEGCADAIAIQIGERRLLFGRSLTHADPRRVRVEVARQNSFVVCSHAVVTEEALDHPGEWRIATQLGPPQYSCCQGAHCSLPLRVEERPRDIGAALGTADVFGARSLPILTRRRSAGTCACRWRAQRWGGGTVALHRAGQGEEHTWTSPSDGSEKRTAIGAAVAAGGRGRM
jgi:hypothetical protein